MSKFKFNKIVDLEWIAENLGSEFLENEQPEQLKSITDEEEVEITFEGNGKIEVYGNILPDLKEGDEIPDSMPDLCFFVPTDGFLTVKLSDGTLFKREYREDYYPEWEVS